MFAGPLPDVPPPALDPFLDAAARCFARYGLKRTSVPDIASEMGVSRVTVYRRVGTVDELSRLLFARELHRLLVELSPSIASVSGPNDIAAIIHAVVSYAREHAVLSKMLEDEPDMVGAFLIEGLPDVVNRIVPAVSPLLRAAMEQGAIAKRDPEVVAEWLVRITASIVLAPTRRELRSFLSEVLEPVFGT